MDAIVAREGVLLALRALERNAGEAGVDGTTKEQPLGYLRTHWEPVKSQLLAGECPRREADIPHPPQAFRRMGLGWLLETVKVHA